MRNKLKLMAMLTLLCFAFTLLPMAAFAADIDYQQCVVITRDSSARTDEDVAIAFGFDGQLDRADVTTTDVYVWFVRDGANVPTLAVTSTEGFAQDSYGIFRIPASQLVEGRDYHFQFANTGSYRVEAALNNPADVSGTTAQKISNVERKFISSSSEIGVETSSSTRDYQIVINGTTYANGSAISLSGLVANNVAQELNMRVLDANGSSASNVRVRVEANSSNLTFDKSSDVTDQLGQVTFRVSTGRTGDYRIYVTCSANSSSTTATQTPTTGTTTTTTTTPSTANRIVMTIGSKTFTVGATRGTLDVAPVIVDNRTFVPFRALAEAFGADVAYDGATRTVTAKLNDTTVVMHVGATAYTVNGAAYTADAAPYIVDGRTMVPIRFIAEAFGSVVTPNYDANGATTDVMFSL